MTCRVVPPEERAYDELLEGLELERLTRRQAEGLAKEVDGVLCPVRAPFKTLFLLRLQVLEVTLAGELDEASGCNSSGEDTAGVGCGRICSSGSLAQRSDVMSLFGDPVLALRWRSVSRNLLYSLTMSITSECCSPNCLSRMMR